MSTKYKASDLVKFFQSKIGTNYVYGMRGSVMTKEKYYELKKQYGSMVWDSDIKKCGTVCVDCSGMFEWFMGVSKSSSGWLQCATEVHPISTIKEAPAGAMVYHKGHIGINLDGVYYLAADGSANGVRKAKYSQAKFTHWMLNTDYFIYDTKTTQKKDDDEVVEKSIILVNDKEYTVEMIRKDGTTYIKTRDIAQVLDMEVSNKGKIPVLNKK